MKKLCAIFFLCLLSNANFADELKQYFDKKASYQMQFSVGPPVDAADSIALAELVDMLKIIIGQKYLEFGTANSNIPTLQPELGADMVDGLVINKANMSIFISTKELVEHSLVKTDIREKPLWKLIEESAFLGKVISVNVAMVWTSLLKRNESRTSGTLLGLRAQDFGPFPPNVIISYLILDKRIYVSQNNIELPVNTKCATYWNQTMAEKSLEFYKKCYMEKIAKKTANFINKQAKLIENQLLVFSRLGGK